MTDRRVRWALALACLLILIQQVSLYGLRARVQAAHALTERALKIAEDASTFRSQCDFVRASQ